MDAKEANGINPHFQVSVYPNPAVDILQVEGGMVSDVWVATDLAGTELPVVWIAPGLMDVRDWKPGVYTLRNGHCIVKVCKL